MVRDFNKLASNDVELDRFNIVSRYFVCLFFVQIFYDACYNETLNFNVKF